MNAAVTAVANRTFAALRFRNYRLYLGSQVISFSGSWMQSLAQAWLVLQLTGSGTALGTVVACQFVPTLLLSPYGGVIADRVNKRKLIMITQGLAGALALVLGIITLTGAVELWMVYVIAAGFGAVTAIDNPTRQTFVMEMVGAADVSNAVTLNSVAVNAARVIGPAIGGVLIATIGVGQCFIVNAVSYLAVIIALQFVRVDELHSAIRAPRAPRQLREGFMYAWNQPMLRTTLIMLVLVGTFTYEFTITLPLLADTTFRAGAGGLAMLSALLGVGAVVGGLVVAAAGPPTARRLVATASLFGVTMMVLAAAPSMTAAYIIMPFVGAASVSMMALSNATLQLNSDPQLRGRVMALFAMAVIGTTPVGGPIVGAIGEHINPRAALAAGGAAAFMAAAFGLATALKHERSAANKATTQPELAAS